MWGTGVSGGVRVIFELANRLQKRGNEVTVTALCGDHRWFPLETRIIYPKPNKFIYLDYLSNITGHHEIKFKLMEKISKIIPSCDVNIATYSLTAYPVLASSKGKPFYYIQHFEPLTLFRNDFMKSIVDDTYYLPLKQIAVSNWLVEKMKSYGKKAIHIQNGIDTEKFYTKPEIERIPNSIMAIFNGIEWKGENDIIVSLKEVAENRKITLMAVGNMKTFDRLIKKHGKINFEIKKYHRPDDEQLSRLYSSAEMFIFASWYEGFGLPALEAMACGTPPVMTDSYGVRDYAIKNYNCLMAKPKDTDELHNCVIKMLEDENLREKLKKNGIKTAKKFTWQKTVKKLEKALKHT